MMKENCYSIPTAVAVAVAVAAIFVFGVIFGIIIVLWLLFHDLT